jgi:hypothetical protein
VFARLPDDFLAVNCFAIHHRADLAVRRAQVEADAAAVQVPPEGFAAFARGRHFLRVAGDDCKGLFVNLFAHELIIELPLATRRVQLLQVFSDALRPADIDLESAFGPQHELDQPFGVVQVFRRARMPIREDNRFKARDFPVGAFQPEDERNATAGGIGAELTVGQRRRAEFRLERRDEFGGDKLKG